MAKCEADGCSVSQSTLPETVDLVSFPTDSRLPVWIEIVKGVGSTWTPNPNSRLCTLHFESNFFHRNSRSCSLLKGAVPTVNLGAHQIQKSPVPPTSPSAYCISSHPSDSPVLHGSSQHHERPLKKTLRSPLKGALKPKSSNRAGVYQFFNQEEDDFLSKTLLRRTVKSLLTHIEDLVMHHELSPSHELELTSMSYILLKVQKNLDLSPDEALDVFQKQIPEKIFTSLTRLIKHFKHLANRQLKSLVRSFALSLHFYSTTVYSYVRQMSENELPHPRTINSWYTTIDKYIS